MRWVSNNTHSGPPDGGGEAYENTVLTADTPCTMDVLASNIAKTVCLPLGGHIVYLAVLMNEDGPVQEQEVDRI